MKRYYKYSKLIITGLLFICCSQVVKSQVNGFVINDPVYPTNHNSGTSFPINVSFNWTNSTTSATAVINYNTAMVSYDPSCSSVLPACMSVTNNSGTGTLTISISNLSACTNTGAISFNVCFYFNCPDTCSGVQKTTTFNGTLTDNLATTQTSNCNAKGITPNNWALQHYFHSYNSMTAEITYKVYYYNFNCFKVKNPFFSVALSPNCGGIITQAWGYNYTYNVSGTTITPVSTPFYSQYSWDTLYYVVKLPCNTCLNTTLTSNITLKGDNCNVPNSIIKGPVPASYLIPAAPASLPNASLQMYSYTGPTRFRARITNTGNTPLNLTATNFIPLVHATAVTQYTNQVGISNTVQYFDCSNIPGSTYPLVGNAVSNSSLPPNTKKILYNINNLLPGNHVDLYVNFDLTSSCSGPAGPGPYTDSCILTYNCLAPPNSCLQCGPGGQTTGTVIYNPQPILQCVNSTYINQCKSVGDTVDICFEFKNVGDAPLIGGQLNAQLPTWLQYVPGSSVYTGFSPNPNYVSLSNAKWNLFSPIPPGTATYKICYKAVVQPGAVGGTTVWWTMATGTNINYPIYCCYSNINICAFAAIGIDKKVKGSLDGSYGTSGNGVAGSIVNYEITLHNTGTIPVNYLEVVDRLPSSTPADLTILGSPNSTPRGSQFNISAMPAVITNCVVSYSNDPNVCTGWTGVGVPCGPPAVANWSGGNKDMRFQFNSSVILAPGGSQTFYFQGQIPANVAGGLHACNTAGFIAKATAPYTGYTINPVESQNVCIEVHDVEVPPGGCCKDLLKKIKEQHSVVNDILSVNLTLTAGPKKLKKVTVSLVNFEVRHPKDCDVCVKDPKYFGNIVPGNNSLPWTTTPAGVPFTHLIAWQDSVGKDWSNGIPVKFTIPLPPRSPIACCCDTIYYCLRYTFTDTTCVMCDTTICYKAYNGKDCKDNGGGNDNPICSCNIKPLFQYETVQGLFGTKNVNCGDVINLFAGNIYTTVIPNFTCKDQNGKDCPGSSISVIIKKPDNTTQVLTGPTYNYTYTLALPGTYQYTITAICGGEDCICKFSVVIPQH